MDPALSLERTSVHPMTVAVSILPEQQLAALNAAYDKAVLRKRLRLLLGAAIFAAALLLAAIGAEVNLRTLFTYFGNFVSYFDRILHARQRPAGLDRCRRMAVGLAQMAEDAG